MDFSCERNVFLATGICGNEQKDDLWFLKKFRIFEDDIITIWKEYYFLAKN